MFDDARLLKSYRTAALILRDRDEAQDATQEAIAQAWARWSSLQDLSRFDAWFERILVNTCLNRLRRRRLVAIVELDEGGEISGPEWHTAAIARLALDAAFAKLSPEQKAIVVLRFWRDLPVEEIALRLGVASGTVKSRLHRALKSLRDAIDSPQEEVE